MSLVYSLNRRAFFVSQNHYKEVSIVKQKQTGIKPLHVLLFCLVFFSTANQVRADTVEPSQTHLIQWGDTLSQLAIDYETPMALLVERNQISHPDLIYAGDDLVLMHPSSEDRQLLVEAERVKDSQRRSDSKIKKLDHQEAEQSRASEQETFRIKLNNVVRSHPFNKVY